MWPNSLLGLDEYTGVSPGAAAHAPTLSGDVRAATQTEGARDSTLLPARMAGRKHRQVKPCLLSRDVNKTKLAEGKKTGSALRGRPGR